MRSGGIGASISAWISENLLEDLDHEVIRLSSQDVPTAYAKLLEDGVCSHLWAEPPSLLPWLTTAPLFARAATIVQAKDVLAAIKKVCA